MIGGSRLARYLPLAAVIMIQALIILVAPSKSPDAEEITAFQGGQGGGSSVDGSFGDGGSSDPFGSEGGTTGGTGGGTGGATGGTTGGGGGSGSGGSGGSGGNGGGGGGGGGSAGDTSHCVNGRQFDPAIWAYAPPCVPTFSGSNGGKTYKVGVTAEKVNVVVYDANLGAAVEAILEAQGSNPSAEEMQAFMNEAAEPFINENYELYGRQIDLIYVRGECQAVPPDYPCLRNEMRQIVQEHNPFWVVWNTSLASPAFDELSRLEVMNSGGWGFRDVFSQRRRPYHWDLLMGGTQQVQQVAEWYCKRMHGDGNAKARYAGEQDDLRDRTRVLGVISTDDPENKLAIDTLKSELARRCGASVAHEYFYAQDITTAEQQRDAAVDEMQKDPEATTIMCFCDLVAPIFLYAECEDRDYYPEHVVVGTGFMDVDSAAQEYDSTLGEKDQFENAFGLAQQNNQLGEFENTAARIWQRTGHNGKAYNANTDWNYYGMVANLVQMAGPDLNPFNVERGSVRLGAIAPGNNQNENFHQRSFDPANGDYTWISTMREVYWSTENTSEFNGEPGTYVSLNGGRWFTAGQYPRGLLELPPKPR